MTVSYESLCFLQDVYSVVAAIPTGCVVTYGQIAYLVGRPQCSRVVGQAMHNVRKICTCLAIGW